MPKKIRVRLFRSVIEMVEMVVETPDEQDEGVPFQFQESDFLALAKASERDPYWEQYDKAEPDDYDLIDEVVEESERADYVLELNAEGDVRARKVHR